MKIKSILVKETPQEEFNMMNAFQILMKTSTNMSKIVEVELT